MLEIVPLPAFQDNYIWTLRNGTHAAVVDPGEARPGARLPRARRPGAGRDPRHAPPSRPRRRHRRTASRITKVPVFGPKGEPIPALTHPVGQGDRVEIPALDAQFFGAGHPGTYARTCRLLWLRFACSAATRCSPAAAAACSKARPRRCSHSLAKLAALPDETRVYCGHEYTLANIRFARAVDPGNAALAAREERAQRLRDAGRPTLPSTLGEERATNPFLRCAEPAVVESANKYLGARIGDPVSVFAAIREWKNRF